MSQTLEEMRAQWRRHRLISILTLRHVSFRIFNWNFEFCRTAKNKISHFRISRPAKYRGRALHWYVFSIRIDQSHLEEVDVCTNCFGDSIVSRISYGDEGWEVCPSCGTVEGPTETVTIEELERREAEIFEMHKNTRITFAKKLDQILAKRRAE